MATEIPIDQPPESVESALTASSERADEIFLKGPRSRLAEFLTLLRVMRDFLRGFRVLHFVGPCVTVFGSSRVHRDDRRRTRHYGSGKPRRQRSRWPLRRVHH